MQVSEESRLAFGTVTASLFHLRPLAKQTVVVVPLRDQQGRSFARVPEKKNQPDGHGCRLEPCQRPEEAEQPANSLASSESMSLASSSSSTGGGGGRAAGCLLSSLTAGGALCSREPTPEE